MIEYAPPELPSPESFCSARILTDAHRASHPGREAGRLVRAREVRMAWPSLSGMGGGGNGGGGGELQQPVNQPQGTEYTLQGTLVVEFNLQNCRQTLTNSRCDAFSAD